jgi:hypothetical protein
MDKYINHIEWTDICSSDPPLRIYEAPFHSAANILKFLSSSF